MAVTTSHDEIVRTCTVCGGTFGYHDLAKSTQHPDGVRPRCLRCSNAIKRAYEGRGSDPRMYDDTAPDRRPAVRLRQQLVRARRSGLPFDEAWSAALAGVDSGPDAASWRDVLEGQRGVWLAAYRREPTPAPALSVELLLTN